MASAQVTIRLEVQNAVKRLPGIIADVEGLEKFIPDWNRYEADMLLDKIRNELTRLIGVRTLRDGEV